MAELPDLDPPTCRLCGSPVERGWAPRRAVACNLAGQWVHVDCRARQQAQEREGAA